MVEKKNANTEDHGVHPNKIHAVKMAISVRFMVMDESGTSHPSCREALKSEV
jgi:hypothetical protein